MFRVCKRKILIFAVISFAQSLWAHDHLEFEDPMSAFHDMASASEIVQRIPVEEPSLGLKANIFIIDQKEPYHEPLALEVYVHCEDNRVVKAKRENKEGSVPTYCQWGEPRVLSDRQVFGDSYERLVVPMATFDESHGHCEPDQPAYEAFPVKSLVALCDDNTI